MSEVGRTLIFAGLGIALLGVLFLVSDRLPWLRLGRLPGDIRIESDSTSLFLPITTMIVLSVLLSGLLWLFGRIRN